MDDDLGGAIDRLVRNGGRLTVEGPAGVVVVLEQPGSRFGILEVRGRLSVPAGDGAEAVLGALPSGWADPTVTMRLGREIRLNPDTSVADGPLIRSRTWRVPPALGSEIAADVRGALGDVTSVDFQPLVTRERRRDEHAAPAYPAGPLPTAVHEELGDQRPDRPVGPKRSIPAPIRAILVVALVAGVGFVWAGMIRGGPRLPGDSQRPSQTGALLGSLQTSSPTPAAAPPASVAATPAAFRLHVVDASTEEPTGSAAAAVDGNPMTAWHAAFGIPQWIEIALDSPSPVKEVMLLIAQSEPGASRHMIQVAKVGAELELVAVVGGETADGGAIFFRPETPIEDVERIRIETLTSPSNAGWYEVIVR